MARGLHVGASEPEQIWDGGPWMMEEGKDFQEGEWRHLACDLKAIATMLGGTGHAAEIVRRDKSGKVKSREFEFKYIAWGEGWRGGL